MSSSSPTDTTSNATTATDANPTTTTATTAPAQRPTDWTPAMTAFVAQLLDNGEEAECVMILLETEFPQLRDQVSEAWIEEVRTWSEGAGKGGEGLEGLEGV